MQTTIDASPRYTSNFRWVILAMTALTGFVVMGFPTTALSAMFSEIADMVQLDLIQIGLVWGVGTVMGIVTTIIAGPLIDYFGTKRSLVVLCIATGLTGALRGFAVDFWTLFLFSFLFGMVQPVLPMNLIKLNREWFAPSQLGLASGIMSAGFATGLMLGSRLAATVLSPMLGGWRGVLIALGILAGILGIVWFFIHPPKEKNDTPRPNIKSILASLRHVAQYRELWVYALASFGVLGLMRGLVGYVPTYLREIGWVATDADTAITLFFLASLIGVVPLSHLSDRLGNRRSVLILATILMSIGTGLMFFAGDNFIFVMVAMVIAGCSFDSFMALNGAGVTEIEGLSLGMMGSALGFVGMMQNTSGTIVPPMGNALSTIGLHVPFLLWAASGIVALVALASFRQNRKRKSQ